MGHVSRWRRLHKLLLRGGCQMLDYCFAAGVGVGQKNKREDNGKDYYEDYQHPDSERHRWNLAQEIAHFGRAQCNVFVIVHISFQVQAGFSRDYSIRLSFR